jgi:hypothetical protein
MLNFFCVKRADVLSEFDGRLDWREQLTPQQNKIPQRFSKVQGLAVQISKCLVVEFFPIFNPTDVGIVSADCVRPRQSILAINIRILPVKKLFNRNHVALR